jgi:hypothetical protein
MGPPRHSRIRTALTSMFCGLLPGTALVFHDQACPVGALSDARGLLGQTAVRCYGLTELRFAALSGDDELFDPCRPLF